MAFDTSENFRKTDFMKSENLLNKSFLMGGFECSIYRKRGGKRLNLKQYFRERKFNFVWRTWCDIRFITFPRKNGKKSLLIWNWFIGRQVWKKPKCGFRKWSKNGKRVIRWRLVRGRWSERALPFVSIYAENLTSGLYHECDWILELQFTKNHQKPRSVSKKWSSLENPVSGIAHASRKNGHCQYRTGARRWINLPYFLRDGCR